MVLWIPLSYLTVSPTRLSLPSVGFPTPFGYSSICYFAVRNPQGISTSGLASFAFARHYSQNLGWFLFLPVLRCFSSRGSPRNAMYLRYVSWLFAMSVSTFGYLRLNAYLQLPAAFRSLSRPSSAPDAKAFALCSYSLELSYQWLFYQSLGSLRSLELLEFHKTFFRLFLLFAVKRLFFLLCIDFTSTFRWNCITLPYFYRKTYTNLLIFVLFVCSFFLLFNLFLLLFGFQWSISCLLP